MAFWSKKDLSTTPREHLEIRVQRGGYSIPEVDEFLRRVRYCASEEIRTVLFNHSQWRPGYEVDDVDRRLDELYEEAVRSGR